MRIVGHLRIKYEKYDNAYKTANICRGNKNRGSDESLWTGRVDPNNSKFLLSHAHIGIHLILLWRLFHQVTDQYPANAGV